MASRQEKIDRAKTAKRGATALRAMSFFYQAKENKANIDAQIAAMSTQLAENRFRSQQAVKTLRRQAKRSTARQTEAYVASGVKLEGSAVDVLADTMHDLLEAELLQEREFSYMEEQTKVAQAGLRTRRDMEDTNAMFNAGLTVLGGMDFK